MRIYFGTVAWDLKMYGIGYKSKWFLGFSMAIYAEREFWSDGKPKQKDNDQADREYGDAVIMSRKTKNKG